MNAARASPPPGRKRVRGHLLVMAALLMLPVAQGLSPGAVSGDGSIAAMGAQFDPCDQTYMGSLIVTPILGSPALTFGAFGVRVTPDCHAGPLDCEFHFLSPGNHISYHPWFQTATVYLGSHVWWDVPAICYLAGGTLQFHYGFEPGYGPNGDLVAPMTLDWSS